MKLCQNLQIPGYSPLSLVNSVLSLKPKTGSLQPPLLARSLSLSFTFNLPPSTHVPNVTGYPHVPVRRICDDQNTFPPLSNILHF